MFRHGVLAVLALAVTVGGLALGGGLRAGSIDAPALSPAADTFIDPTSPGSHGQEQTFVVRDAAPGAIALIRFGDLPAGQEIASARLQLSIVVPPTAPMSISVAPVASTWDEATASTAELAIGPLGGSAVVPTSVLADQRTIEWDVTSDVRAFVAGTSTNNGWALLASPAPQGSSVSSVHFASREHLDATLHPRLIITLADDAPAPTAEPTTPPGPDPTNPPTPGEDPPDAPVPPPPPSLDAGVPLVTEEASVTLTGAKEPGTGIWIDGDPAVAVNELNVWSATVELALGENRFVLTARDASGNESEPLEVSITRTERDLFFTLARPTSPTPNGQATLRGEKGPNVVVEVNGVASLSDEDSWWMDVVLNEGENSFVVQARNGERDGPPARLRLVRDSVPPKAPTGLASVPDEESCQPGTEAYAEWNAATDRGTGVAGYRYRWDANAEGVVDGGAETRALAVRETLGAGQWYLHIAAFDHAGGLSPVKHLGPICLAGETGPVEGSVFIDADRDGRYAVGAEDGLENWTVTARSGEIALETKTDEDGAYVLDAPLGAVELCVTVPSRYRLPWSPTTGPTGDGDTTCRRLEVGPGPQGDWYDFGYYRDSAIEGRIYEDLDADGRWDEDEPGAEGAEVTAHDGDGAEFRSTTDEEGAYALELAPGEYLLCVAASGELRVPEGPDAGCWAIAVRSEHDVRGPTIGLVAEAE